MASVFHFNKINTLLFFITGETNDEDDSESALLNELDAPYGKYTSIK